VETAPDQLVAEGFVAFRQGRDEDAKELFERSSVLARESGNRQALAQALGGLARVALRAEELYNETLALARRLGLRFAEAAELLNLGYVALMRNWRSSGGARASRLAPTSTTTTCSRTA
jgi:hypothetical protein